MNADQSVKEIGCELEEAGQDWKGNRFEGELPALFHREHEIEAFGGDCCFNDRNLIMFLSW